MAKPACKLLSRENLFWTLLYSCILAYFLLRYALLPYPDCASHDNDQWLRFKQAVTLPLCMLLGAVFVQMFSNPIESPSTAGMKEEEKTAALAETQRNMSLQRRNWMIFAYSFMLVALLVPIYLFGPGWDTQKNLSLSRNNDVHNPVGIFVGCAVSQQQGELSCKPSATANSKVNGEAGNPSASNVAATSNQETDTDKPDATSAIGGAWVLNLGGHVINACNCAPTQACQTGDSCNTCNKNQVAADGNKTPDTYSVPACACSGGVCQVRGGLLVPIYVIILALFGGSISLTRRLPEYQKCANPEFISTEKESRLTQHEFREYLVFQMVQFISAPLLAILAYFLVDPNNPVASVVLAFSAGFASESILLMVRALTEKFTPTGGAPASGTLTGMVTLAAKPVKNAEVVMSASSQVRAVTDEAGFYVLNNIPLGEHGVKVSADGCETTTGSVKIERAQEIVRQHWSLKQKA